MSAPAGTAAHEGERVVRVLHVLPDLAMGGGQQVLRRLLADMDRRRFAHTVCYFLPDHTLRAAFTATGARVAYLPWRGPASSPRTFAGVVRTVREDRIDIVHVNGTPIDKLHGQLAALVCRRPVVSTLHGPRWRPGARGALLLHRLRETLELGLDPWTTRRVVAVSESVLESWRPYLLSRRVPADRMLVCPNGIPTAEFDAAERGEEIERLRRELGVEGAAPLLVTVGRLDPNKGHRFLISAMRRLAESFPRSLLLVAGEGPLEAELREAARTEGVADRVRLLGRRDDVPALLGLADVFVFSSLGEGLPLVVLEAMAAGRPVVTFRLPGLAPILEDGVHGFQVEPRDVDALAERVVRLARDPERARRMGVEARRRVVDAYDVAASVRRLEAVYEEVAGA